MLPTISLLQLIRAFRFLHDAHRSIEVRSVSLHAHTLLHIDSTYRQLHNPASSGA